MLDVANTVNFSAERPPDVDAVAKAWNDMVFEAERAYARDARFGRVDDAADGGGFSSLIGSAAGPSFYAGFSGAGSLRRAAEAALGSLDKIPSLYADDERD